MTIKKAQDTVDAWIKDHGVRYFNELTNMAILTEEVGELARVIARTYGEQSFKETDKKANLSEELADVFFVLICIANQTGINLTDAFIETLQKKTERDRLRHKNNSKIN
jgi:NTP pyrophosphatase (non-canonical NTP hydrolase)